MYSFEKEKVSQIVCGNVIYSYLLHTMQKLLEIGHTNLISTEHFHCSMNQSRFLHSCFHRPVKVHLRANLWSPMRPLKDFKIWFILMNSQSRCLTVNFCSYFIANCFWHILKSKDANLKSLHQLLRTVMMQSWRSSISALKLLYWHLIISY